MSNGITINAQVIRDDLNERLDVGIPASEEHVDLVNKLTDDQINSVIENISSDMFWELFDELVSIAIVETVQFAHQEAS